jgi:predicted Zn finger-like uncharacterized protein
VLIDCPGCNASYHITKAALGPNGRKVTCARCEAVWLAKSVAPEATPQILTEVAVSDDDRFRPARPSDFARSIATAPPPAERAKIPDFVHNFCAGALLLLLAMGLIASRGAVARAWPGAGRLYAAIGIPVSRDGLAIRDLHTVMSRIDGTLYLGVEGVIINSRADETGVPPVRLIIRDAQKTEIYAWTVAAERRTLGAGESLLFRARLAEPPTDGRDVVARFATADDTIAAR